MFQPHSYSGKDQKETEKKAQAARKLETPTPKFNFSARRNSFCRLRLEVEEV